MIELVTLEQVKRRLKYDGDADDANLQDYIWGASRMVLNYLKIAETAYADSDGNMELDSETMSYPSVPAEVQVATILLVGILVRDPDAAEIDDWEAGYLPRPVTAILYPLRDPTAA
jgi:hypothetical protein